MKPLLTFSICFLLCLAVNGQSSEPKEAGLLRYILKKNYQPEKIIVKNRMQLLFFYCQKAPNTPEILQVIKDNPELKSFEKELKAAFKMPSTDNWNAELTWICEQEGKSLTNKINGCKSKEDFLAITEKKGSLIQRLLIVNKPIYFGSNQVLVRVASFKSSEHNSSGYYWFEQTEQGWVFKKIISDWTTSSIYGNQK